MPFLLVRRKILRLPNNPLQYTHAMNMLETNAFLACRDAKYCVSRPRHSNPAINYMLKNKCFSPRETQDFASLLLLNAYNILDFS